MPVTIVLKEPDFDCLLRTVPVTSKLYEHLQRAGERGRVPGILNMHNRVAVTCPLEVAKAVLAAAQAACPEAVDDIRTAIDESAA
jgi:hypothetical protein